MKKQYKKWKIYKNIRNEQKNMFSEHHESILIFIDHRPTCQATRHHRRQNLQIVWH